MMTEEQKQALIEHAKMLMRPDGKGKTTAVARIALAALTQPASPALKLPDVQEQVIGVWSPSANEIAVRKLSGIKVVDFAHWHCHCTKEVVIRDISDHPAILNAPHTAPIEPICATGGAEWVKVSERMPEDESWVLVTNGKHVGVGAYFLDDHLEDDESWQDEHFEFINLQSKHPVTHWMPLPEAPKP